MGLGGRNSEPILQEGENYYPLKYYQFDGTTVSSSDAAIEVCGDTVFKSKPMEDTNKDGSKCKAVKETLDKLSEKLKPFMWKPELGHRMEKQLR